ncbi:transporter substrate-binding domain-containing protein [Paenisporosarcina indica]|uniref:transporter substrate-binding domain-containing protein n=1 Tax=Paenisporosarcina indica TaxID=650093 RepID=UPI000950006B|nr:transporter substrate-binding domain-containing protein [Paenisporosarcina indica]
MSKKWNLFSAVALSAIVLTACGTDTTGSTAKNGAEGSSDKKVLEMATSADFPPFESRDTAGNFEGFDIDLANYIADEMGYELKIQDMKFDGLIGALQSDRVDLVLSGMSATDKRKKNVDFSIEYNRSGEMFITLKDSDIQTLEDLEGKTVGVQLGTIQEDGANKIKEDTVDFELKAVDNANILIQELLSNRIDVAYMDKAVAQGYIAEQDLAGFNDPTTSSPGMAVAFPKGSDLIKEVNAAIEKAEESGKLQELKDKWLSEE